MTTLRIEVATLLAADPTDPRRVSGLLLPFGEQGHTNLGRVTVQAGSVEIPEDVTILPLNHEHAREQPRGRFLDAAESPEGLVASWTVGRGATGDELLAGVKAGRPPALSVELADVVIRAGAVIRSRLIGAAVVRTPAFPSATLVAADAGELPTPTPTGDPMPDAKITLDANATVDGGTVTATTGSTPAPTAEAGQLAASAPAAPAAAAAPAAPTAPAVAPLLGSAPAAPAPAKGEALRSMFATISRAYLGDPDAVAELTSSGAGSLFASIGTTVKYDGTGAPGNAARLPQWLGELWAGVEFVRRVVPLLGTGELTGLEFKGWRWKTKPEVATWGGNGANVPTTTAETEPYTGTAQRYAGGISTAIEYAHFGESSMVEAILRMMAESYARKSDAYALAEIQAKAVVTAPGTVPAGVAPAAAWIVDGALAMLDEANASYALINPADYRTMLFTRAEDSLEFLSQSLQISREGGNLAGFKIQPHSAIPAGKALVGAKEAATVLELPGSPIRVNGQDIAKGVLDNALFGYIGVRVDLPAGLRLVQTAP